MLESRRLIFYILSRQKTTGYPIFDKLFCKNKNSVSLYIKFYLEHMSSDGIPYDTKKIYISSAISLFLSYITNKNKNNTKYIIEDSELIRIF
ncbi:unnamed protein product [Blepharisma stoltei]|uniref:Uncharacterized protein n=1 Tax=Blepharisma stoltei TaxID=1481888 RepID=A0AAU9JQR4_9CILI|nr:unnamed protein product [Blepharisma stoltei]